MQHITSRHTKCMDFCLRSHLFSVNVQLLNVRFTFVFQRVVDDQRLKESVIISSNLYIYILCLRQLPFINN